MALQEEHRRRVAAFPGDVRGAHDHSCRHRPEILRSDLCGCFYCFAVFGPGDIREWTDTDDSGKGTTALCPRCGIDSVLGSASGFPLGRPFLEKMHRHWFVE
jgi:hypothetical protein